MNIFPFPHFAEHELRCKCNRHKDAPLCNVSPRLLMLAEKIRGVLKTPMVVTSCCRCPEHNREVGGSPSSKHIATPEQPARAMDFKPRNMSPLTAYNAIVKAWHDGRLTELGGIGLYDSWIHIDTAKAADGHLRTWDNRSKKE